MNQSIVLLHGALGSQQQLEPLKEVLQKTYLVHSFNFIGHGGNEIPDTLSMNDMVEQLRQYIEANIPADHELTLFGYSMGGYAALLLASKNVCKIDRIITLGTKLDWNVAQAENEIKMLNPAIIEEKIPAFAQELKTRHQPADWKLLLEKTAEMIRDLGENQYLNSSTYAHIHCPCKLMVGDKDKMVTLDETVNAHKCITGSRLSVLPSTPHPIEKVDMHCLELEIINAG
jgi:pimeloyl-ACP methyl ester carboxylesterase